MSAFRDLSLLEAFVCIIESGSISAGSRRLKTQQSSVSRQLQALEKRRGNGSGSWIPLRSMRRREFRGTPDATHSGAGELEIYLEFNADNSAATRFLCGPNDGSWIPWCTLIATRYLLDYVEITAIIFELKEQRWFISWLKTRCNRHEEMLDRYRNELSADFKAGMR
jgi:hypothetical protein